MVMLPSLAPVINANDGTESQKVMDSSKMTTVIPLLFAISTTTGRGAWYEAAALDAQLGNECLEILGRGLFQCLVAKSGIDELPK